MPNLLSKEQIINQAFDYLKEAPIESIGNTTNRADWALRNYDQLRQETLLVLPWGFARQYWELPRHPDTPPGPWRYQFTRPNDLLKMEPLRINGDKRQARVPYEVNGNFIITNYEANPLILKGWRDVTNEGEFSTQFVNVFALWLAVKASHYITGKASLRQELRDTHTAALDAARIIELRENPHEAPVQDTSAIHNVRNFAWGGSSSSARW